MMIEIMVNGVFYVLDDVDVDMFLLWVLCDWFKLMGIKFGCGGGFCGVCIVYLDGVLICVCIMLVLVVVGYSVIIIEGLLKDGMYLL